jgi:hypothetical protein
MVKMLPAAGITDMFHPEITVVFNKDGSVDIPEKYVEEFRSHGFSIWGGNGAEIPIEAMTHQQRKVYVIDRTRRTLETISEEELLKWLKDGGQGMPSLPDEREAPGVQIDRDNVSAEDIDNMNRVELFAYLKAAGVAVAIPITNDQLRDIAMKTLSGKKA